MIFGIGTDIVDTDRISQLKSLKKFAEKILSPDELDNFDKLPSYPTIFLANEFFDALPIKQFIKTNNEWYENFVSLNKSGKFSLEKKKLLKKRWRKFLIKGSTKIKIL